MPKPKEISPEKAAAISTTIRAALLSENALITSDTIRRIARTALGATSSKELSITTKAVVSTIDGSNPSSPFLIDRADRHQIRPDLTIQSTTLQDGTVIYYNSATYQTPIDAQTAYELYLQEQAGTTRVIEQSQIVEDTEESSLPMQPALEISVIADPVVAEQIVQTGIMPDEVVSDVVVGELEEQPPALESQPSTETPYPPITEIDQLMTHVLQTVNYRSKPLSEAGLDRNVLTTIVGIFSGLDSASIHYAQKKEGKGQHAIFKLTTVEIDDYKGNNTQPVQIESILPNEGNIHLDGTQLRITPEQQGQKTYPQFTANIADTNFVLEAMALSLGLPDGLGAMRQLALLVHNIRTDTEPLVQESPVRSETEIANTQEIIHHPIRLEITGQRQSGTIELPETSLARDTYTNFQFYAGTRADLLLLTSHSRASLRKKEQDDMTTFTPQAEALIQRATEAIIVSPHSRRITAEPITQRVTYDVALVMQRLLYQQGIPISVDDYSGSESVHRVSNVIYYDWLQRYSSNTLTRHHDNAKILLSSDELQIYEQLITLTPEQASEHYTHRTTDDILEKVLITEERVAALILESLLLEINTQVSRKLSLPHIASWVNSFHDRPDDIIAMICGAESAATERHRLYLEIAGLFNLTAGVADDLIDLTGKYLRHEVGPNKAQ